MGEAFNYAEEFKKLERTNRVVEAASKRLGLDSVATLSHAPVHFHE